MTVVGKKNEHIENSANGQTLKDLRNSMWDDMFENMQISFSETKCFSKNCGHIIGDIFIWGESCIMSRVATRF